MWKTRKLPTNERETQRRKSIAGGVERVGVGNMSLIKNFNFISVNNDTPQNEKIYPLWSFLNLRPCFLEGVENPGNPIERKMYIVLFIHIKQKEDNVVSWIGGKTRKKTNQEKHRHHTPLKDRKKLGLLFGALFNIFQVNPSARGIATMMMLMLVLIDYSSSPQPTRCMNILSELFFQL